MAETSTIFGFMKYVSATDILSDFKKTVDSHFVNSLSVNSSRFFLYIKILVSEQGNAVCEKLSNCHNLLIMRNDKKDY